jgi:hypothetical protein
MSLYRLQSTVNARLSRPASHRADAHAACVACSSTGGEPETPHPPLPPPLLVTRIRGVKYKKQVLPSSFQEGLPVHKKGRKSPLLRLAKRSLEQATTMVTAGSSSRKRDPRARRRRPGRGGGLGQHLPGAFPFVRLCFVSVRQLVST